MLMYGLRRSPILAHFQKIPITLDLRARGRLQVSLGGSCLACCLLMPRMWGTPSYPFLFRSMMPGAKWWTYVLVHIRRRMTWSRDWKLKRAVCGGARGNGELAGGTSRMGNSGGGRSSIPC